MTTQWFFSFAFLFTVMLLCLICSSDWGYYRYINWRDKPKKNSFYNTKKGYMCSKCLHEWSGSVEAGSHDCFAVIKNDRDFWKQKHLELDIVCQLHYSTTYQTFLTQYRKKVVALKEKYTTEGER